jgi:hypothetical protein
MRALVVYESMFGNTREIAEAIAAGLTDTCDVVVLPVAEATDEQVDAAGLLVVGGPTHAHGMTSAQSRKGAPNYVEKSHGELHLEPGYEGPGLRDWFAALPPGSGFAAAFDTRVDGPPLLTGHASKGIADRLRKHGYAVLAEPESFLVGKANQLKDGETERATGWARGIAASLAETY